MAYTVPGPFSFTVVNWLFLLFYRVHDAIGRCASRRLFSPRQKARAISSTAVLAAAALPLLAPPFARLVNTVVQLVCEATGMRTN